MIRNRLKRTNKRVKDLVLDSVVEKAASLNPLSDKVEEPRKIEEVPQITNETIAEHREEVLSGARKFIYPLQHSKHRIVVITVGIVVAASIAFLVYCLLGMYKLYQHNAFLYRVTQVVPFPIAKAGDDFVAYENYLFELRRYAHYHETQRQDEFGGEKQLNAFRQQALDYAIRNAYVKDLAHENDVKVTNKEVDTRITEVRNQNRL
ncbi:MAG: SurA N-terminal domain-containing protein, partial [Candidatus Saccharimonadales bacterium]